MPLELIEPHRHRPALEGLSSAGRFLDITSKEQWRVYQNPVRQGVRGFFFSRVERVEMCRAGWARLRYGCFSASENGCYSNKRYVI